MGMYGRLAWMMVMVSLAGCTAHKDAASLTPVHFKELPGFSEDDHTQALQAFRQSCGGPSPVMASGLRNFPVSSPATWQRLCAAAARSPDDAASARRFFTDYFTAYRVSGIQGHFTGYYVPVLQASRQQEGAYRYPVYAMPPELKDGSAPRPYFDRARIESGALAGRGLELLWCDDPVMLFFAHVQGSASVELPDGHRLRIVFAGKNGLPYHAIGKTLLERGALQPGNVSLHTIRDWLYANPTEAAAVMRSNPSFIFFTLDEKNNQVRGAHGTALTPGRSLAVDRSFIPLGVPLYITTEVSHTPYRRILIAQDTGSAILGAARGDIFFGYGEDAEAQAGAMDATGEMYLLLPRGAADGRG